MSKLEYTEYQSVVDLINKADQDNVYQELIGKETKTLDTINRVVKYYNDNDYK
jgi:cell fate regulator YaaT (PSP1 superfamily)